MALELLTTTAFEKDLRRLTKQGRHLDRLEAIVDLLQTQEQLPVRCRPHPFRGNWAGYWDCHVGPDSRAPFGGLRAGPAVSAPWFDRAGSCESDFRTVHLLL
jgi:addiction module RelE/StbE family toxin